jgi:translation initiation factor 1 (eIF-1/SUI1)
MSNTRKKPQKLEISIGILSQPSSEGSEVQIKGPQVKQSNPANNKSDGAAQIPTPIKGQVKLRREVKGRAGKPVSVLFGFDDPAAAQSANLKALQARLKDILACGGTYDEDLKEIILQVDDLARVRQALGKVGMTVKEQR